MSNNTKATTFWNFLKENTIEIPIIQRDYAQGRLGKENLRKNFLKDLRSALNDKGTLKLDFVYGSMENGNLNPLDGQQRLTTLWLLHWYIALHAGELNEDNCKIFRNFTYETRISSREFCENLCKPEYFRNFNGNDIVGFITKQTWFYSAWKQDPTIQSMLRMLGGTKIADKNGDDIIDGFEELFKCSSGCVIDGKVNCGFKRYWEKLVSVYAPIVFYYLPLHDFGLSDDLYIKMNARGKQLTSFENFKADLIGYITKQAEGETLDENKRAEWGELLDPESGIPIKLDTDWTDIFWKNKSNDNRIDEIYFAFINRFSLQELICAKKEDNTDLYSADYLEKEDGSFKHLYGEKGDDSLLHYSGFEKYLFLKKIESRKSAENSFDKEGETEEKSIPLSFFKSFRDSLNNFFKSEIFKSEKNCILNNCFPAWVDSKFEFVPKYDEKGIITTLGQKERVAFLAVCRYLEKGGFDSISFKRWMRVVWNIVENSGIETISAMIGAMRLIDELSKHSHDIYQFLSKPQPEIKSDFAKDQVKEEILKAKQILDENGTLRKYVGSCKKTDGSNYITWEEIIIEAEKYAFFKGAIRFLFTDGNGNINWNDDFDTKWENAQKYFDENGVKNDNKVFLTKSLVIQCDNWNEQLYDKQIFNPNARTWKWILTAKNWIVPVHNILRASNINDIGATNEKNNENVKKFISPIIKDLPFNYFINNEPDGRFRWLGPRLCFYKPYGRDMATLDWENWYRNKILSSLLGSITTGARMGDSNLFWGWNIKFSYNNNYFQWYGNPNEKVLDVYLMENDWAHDKERPNPTSDKGTDEDRYYCFRVTKDMESDESKFIGALDELIKQPLNL